MKDYEVIPALLAAALQNTVVLHFPTIEKKMKRGHELPESAKTYSAWWTKQPHSFSYAWLAQGFQVESVDLVNQRVCFFRQSR
ncbi:DUF7662 domain-containing protein [Enterococcus faecalis]